MKREAQDVRVWCMMYAVIDDEEKQAHVKACGRYAVRWGCIWES